MPSRYIPNTFPELLTLSDTTAHLKSALEDIVTNCPPQSSYRSSSLQGLWSGPTGIAYLFLHVSSTHPHLRIANHHALTWAKSYIKASRGPLRLSSHGCGIGDEKLCHDAVAACITKDASHVSALVSDIPSVLDGDYPNELLYGRAGTLYLLRMVRAWVPDAAALVDEPIRRVSDKILAAGPGWMWHGKRYLGAVHGDVGIVAQLALAAPSAPPPRLEAVLDRLLDAQLADGNWPGSEGRETAPLVQFCHGAPGFMHALLALRGRFPGLRDKIDAAVEKGRECIWRQGLLRKEPSLCHGIFGNGLALEHGPRREHFLAVATPENMAALIREDKTLFEPADYGKPYSLTTSYTPSAAWAWMVCGQETPGVIAFSDV